MPKRKAGRGKDANAAKHLLNSRATVREQRDAARRAAEREWREVLRERGLSQDRLARVVASQAVRLDAAARRMEGQLNSRGWFDRQGNPKAAVKTLVDVVVRLLAETRNLLERIQPIPTASDSTWSVSFADGTDTADPREVELAAQAGRESTATHNAGKASARLDNALEKRTRALDESSAPSDADAQRKAQEELRRRWDAGSDGPWGW